MVLGALQAELGCANGLPEGATEASAQKCGWDLHRLHQRFAQPRGPGRPRRTNGLPEGALEGSAQKGGWGWSWLASGSPDFVAQSFHDEPAV